MKKRIFGFMTMAVFAAIWHVSGVCLSLARGNEFPECQDILGGLRRNVAGVRSGACTSLADTDPPIYTFNKICFTTFAVEMLYVR